MQRLKSDDFFWEMAASEEGELSPPTDATLRAYVEGRLDPAEQAACEAHLTQSPQGRDRLVELTGVQLDSPSEALRERVLAHLPKPVRVRGEPKPHRQHSRRHWLTAAAAVIALAVVGLQFFVPQPSDRTFADFTVHASGIKTDRSAGDASLLDASAPFRAYANTEVTINARIQGEPVRKTEYGLYLRRADRLVRIEIPTIVTHSCSDFVATAREIVGETPGTYSLFVVAGLPGELPDRVELDDRDPSQALARESRGRVQPVAPLQLLAEP